jgi:hypothetical protein
MVPARAMVKAHIAGRPMHEVLDCKGRLRASRDDLFEASSTEQFSLVHRFVAEEILQHIEHIEQRVARMDQYLLEGLRAASAAVANHHRHRSARRGHAAGRDRHRHGQLR